MKKQHLFLITTILYWGMFCLIFTGCNDKTVVPTGIHIMDQSGYVPLKTFTLEVQVKDVRKGFIRNYSVEDKNLSDAGTYYGRKHQLLINSPFERFKIIHVNEKTVIQYKYIRYKPYVHLDEDKIEITNLQFTSDYRIMHVDLDPGQYLIIPWDRYSPIETMGYGLRIRPKSSSKQTKTPPPLPLKSKNK